jgi:mercuric reductase
MARQHSETAAITPRRRPQVPDRRFIATQAAGEALDGILAAGWYDKRFGDLSLPSASMLAAVLRFYGDEGRPPSIAESAAITALLEPDAEQHLADLQRHDLLIRSPDDGTIAGAYPFTQRRTGHTVTLVASGRTLNTMCAIDALGAGAMCREDTVIRSNCHACRSPLVIDTHASGFVLGEVQPRDAIVWTGFRPSCGCAADTLCAELVFFCSERHLDEWRTKNAGAGRQLTVEEGFQVGKALFADRALLGGD